MRYRLRPVRPRHRGWVRLTLAALLMPLIGILVLARLDVAHRPLDEREAALAVDLQRAHRGEEASAAPDHGRWTWTAEAVVSHLPRLAGNRELQLRLAGMLAGALALGMIVALGTGLFATRVGIAVAALLLVLPTGRRLLGIELAVEPFYLACMTAALLGMRGMAEARVAAVFAGLASGLAVAFAGLDAIWLPLMALAWLRVNQGLTFRSAGVVLGTTVASAAAALAAGWVLFGRIAGEPLVPDLTWLTFLDPAMLRPAPAARELIPLLPLVVLGLWTMRGAWWQSEPFRFLLLWLVLAAGSWALTGAGASAYVAILFLACAVSLLALRHARLLVSLPACGVALGLATALWHPPALSNTQQADRWAVRATGRFIGRMIGPDRKVVASVGAAHRLAFYGNRDVGVLESTAPPFARADYMVLPRSAYRRLRAARKRREGAGHDAREVHLKRIAEFGNWVVLRQENDAS